MNKKQKQQQVRNQRFYYKDVETNKKNWSKRYKQWQETTSETATKSRRLWSASDERALRIGRFKTDFELALLFKRTYSAIRSKRGQLGISKRNN
jgi:hypothetical protein